MKWTYTFSGKKSVRQNENALHITQWSYFIDYKDSDYKDKCNGDKGSSLRTIIPQVSGHVPESKK